MQQSDDDKSPESLYVLDEYIEPFFWWLLYYYTTNTE